MTGTVGVSILKPQAPLVDPKTGRVNRDWYRYLGDLNDAVSGAFLSLSQLVDVVETTPSPNSQVSSLSRQVSDLRATVLTTPSPNTKIAELERQVAELAALVLTAREPIGGTGANPTATAGPVAIDGSASTFMRSDAAPAVQVGSDSQLGIVGVDGTTLLATAGVLSLNSNAGTFVPVFTFATPGDLSVSYSVQQGTYLQIGSLVLATYGISCTPTFTTSSGGVRVTGLPIAPDTSVAIYYGAGGITGLGVTYPTGTTQSIPNLNTASSRMTFSMAGSGIASVNLAASNITSGQGVTISVTVLYRTDAAP